MDEYIDELMRMILETAVVPKEDEFHRASKKTFGDSMMVLSTPQCTPTFRRKAPSPQFVPIIYSTKPDLNRVLSMNLLKERMLPRQSAMMDEFLDSFTLNTDNQFFKPDYMYDADFSKLELPVPARRCGMSMLSYMNWFNPDPLSIKPKVPWPSVGTIGHIDRRKPLESALTQILRMRNGNYEPTSCASVQVCQSSTTVASTATDGKDNTKQ